MSRSSRSRRGYTLAEVLSVTFVLSLALTIVAAIVGPLLNAQGHTQAKVDTIQAAASAFYRLERDLRNSDYSDIWLCTTAGSPSCSTGTTTLSPAQAIVIQTAYTNGIGQFQVDPATGTPKWQGATVYWIDAAGDLDVAFDVPSSWKGYPSNLTANDAANAVSDVMASGGMHLARPVERLALAFPATGQGHKMTLQLQALSTVNGTTNETTYQTDLETRN